MFLDRQWLWLSWQSGHFRHQRSAVRIPSLAKFILNIVCCQLYWKDENKEKEAGKVPFYFKNISLHNRFSTTSKISQNKRTKISKSTSKMQLPNFKNRNSKPQQISKMHIRKCTRIQKSHFENATKCKNRSPNPHAETCHSQNRISEALLIRS